MVKFKPLEIDDVTRYCKVDLSTVTEWIQSGELKAYTTAGGHYRIRKGDFKTFLREHQLPIREDFFTHPKRVLVVDDEPDVVEFITRALEGEGWELDSAADGFEAGLKVAYFEPDLITLDLRMPQLDGFETCRRVREDPITQGIKILVVTGYPEQIDEVKEVADGYMIKPLEVEELRRKVRRLLE